MFRLFGKKQRNDPRTQLAQACRGFELPSFPALVTTALATLLDEDAGNAAIADSIACDPALTVQILATLNSPAFALRRPVRDLQHAIGLLGRSELESQLISAAVRTSLPCTPTQGFEPGRFWRTASRRATTARALADLLHPATRSASFTASLLQDMAVPVLAQQAVRTETPYGELLDQWHHGDDDLAALEGDALGFDHAMMAHWMCEEWGFPTPLTAAIGTHHGDHDGTMPAVQLVAPLREIGEDKGTDRIVSTAHALFGVPEDRTVALIEESFESADSMARLFS